MFVAQTCRGTMVGSLSDRAPSRFGRPNGNQEIQTDPPTSLDDGWSYAIRVAGRDSHAGVLCARGSQSLVRAGVCRSMRAGISLWVPAGSLAVRRCRGDLGGGCRSTLAQTVKLRSSSVGCLPPVADAGLATAEPEDFTAAPVHAAPKIWCRVQTGWLAFLGGAEPIRKQGLATRLGSRGVGLDTDFCRSPQLPGCVISE
jgi:hypothetical protein